MPHPAATICPVPGLVLSRRRQSPNQRNRAYLQFEFPDLHVSLSPVEFELCALLRWLLASKTFVQCQFAQPRPGYHQRTRRSHSAH